MLRLLLGYSRRVLCDSGRGWSTGDSSARRVFADFKHTQDAKHPTDDQRLPFHRALRSTIHTARFGREDGGSQSKLPRSGFGVATEPTSAPRAYVFTRRRFSPCMGCHKYRGLQTRIGCLTGRTIADLMRATHLDRPQNERDMEGRSLQILCTYTERPGE